MPPRSSKARPKPKFVRLHPDDPADLLDPVFLEISGGINLEAFQDKVLQPIMGWDRNAHAYLFTDLSDGAGFGPRDASTVDISHKDSVGYEFLHADEYILAHLLQSEGEAFE
ncbi:hypothetical protein SISNIDRAFT_488933 [Sistotremastrum niveocremeum HHB9708]|uniref:Uncharacterized protein n=1 Tax=Sistotremastrum niveocremeum HHB9708 TaxID=1314777 RepID=A0A164QL97_9AGAM|nr:hypothetical protein SISNIDRAFT_488933 [Sistotremastrum niveocremeum HHB9708]